MIQTVATPIEIQTNGRLPIRCFTDEALLPDQAAQDQLQQLAAVPGLQQYVAVLPDVHYKSRNPSPTGTVVVSKDVILPRAIDGGINCGIRAMATPLSAGDFSPQLLDALFGRLMEAIPRKWHPQPLLSAEECEEVLVHGQSKLVELLGLPADEVTRVENGGRLIPYLEPEMIRAGLTPAAIQKAIRKGSNSLGTVGGGNHFLEMQEIVEVLDEEVAERLGLERGKVVFMLHSDSRRLGKKILQPLLEEAERTYRNSDSRGELWTLPVESELGRRYVCALAAASNAGFASRAAVTHILRQTLRELLADPSLPLSLIYDCGHETIKPERVNGDWAWVHRHGASRALPPSMLSYDPVLGETGQPVPVPGSMGAESYIVVARPGTARSFHSVAHGAGRVIAKDQAAEEFDAAQVENELLDQGVRLYRYGVDNIAGQAPASFKDARQVLDVMTALDLTRPVVRLRPMAVLKG